MKYLIILLIVFCVVGAAFAQTSQNDEATRLSAEVVKLFGAKKYKEAVPIAEKVVQIRETQLGANHLKTGEALRNLGFSQQASGNKKDAEKTLERAIVNYEGQTDLTKNSQIELMQMLEIVAFSKYKNDKIETAIALYQKASDISEKVYGRDALETAATLWSLANIYQIQQNYENSEKLYRRVLEIRAKILGINDWETQDAKVRYQCVSFRNDNNQAAEKFISSLKSEYPDKGKAKLNSNSIIIDGGIINGKATYLARPGFPLIARGTRTKATIKVQITVDEAGKVIFACAVSGDKSFYNVSETAAFNSIFEPTIFSGKPVKVSGFVIYNFVP